MRILYFISFFLITTSLAAQEEKATPLSEDEQVIRLIYEEALSNGECHENLRTLCKNVGHRLVGSVGAENAVIWGEKVMKKMSFDRIFLQETDVPYWERGEKEKARIIDITRKENEFLNICALGGSVGTGVDGITAEVIEVRQFEELEQLGKEKIEGKIIFYNRAMDPKHINTFRAYGGSANQRGSGASKAAPFGAVAVLVRSMTLALDDYPHTGAMHYEKDINKIPAAAISTNDAELLSSKLKKGKVEVFMQMNCKTMPDKLSHNVIGEIKGEEFPDEIIVVGGHLDSWDKGEGAHDDGAGCVQSIEVLRIFKALDIKPKRTIRAVLFMNEEFGLNGGRTYARIANEKKENHIAAIESDAGGFTPRGFSIDATEEKIQQVMKWKYLLEPYGLHDYPTGFSGADISPLKDSTVTLIGYRPDTQRYFDFHHSDADVFEVVNKRELELGAASMAALVYLIDKYGIK